MKALIPMNYMQLVITMVAWVVDTIQRIAR